MGSVDYRNPDQLIPVAQFHVHPQHNSTTLDFDFAVITLQTAASLNSNVGTVAMATSETTQKFAVATGWGYNEPGWHVQTTPRALQKGTFPLMSQEECQFIWGTVMEITDRMQCVGGNGKVSVCSVSGTIVMIKKYMNIRC